VNEPTVPQRYPADTEIPALIRSNSTEQKRYYKVAITLRE